MKIALVSFEYPPDTAFGGIATYKLHAARMLRDRGHHIEVFAASPHREGTFEDDGISIHRVRETERFSFPSRIAKLFVQRHAEVGFDVVEAPEYFADAWGLIHLVPDMPLVVKLHTPSYLLWMITFGHSRWAMARNTLASLRRGQLPPWHPNHGLERGCALQADEIAAPCKIIGESVTKAWGLDPGRVAHVPNLYEPADALLEIDPKTQNNTVTFLGRLEVRKGVIDLARAIPLVLRQLPDVKFRLVGRSVELRPGLQMETHLRELLAGHLGSVEFTGPVPLEQIPRMLAETDICVFPSIWENFPNVCLEAMSAARGVVGSSAGGMSEILDFGAAGVLVPPRNPRELADAIIKLCQNPALRIKLGMNARARVLSEYNAQRVGQLQEASYRRAIAARRAAGPRTFAGSATRRTAG
ncbi:MAG: glycosyltransferase family 4 protein [Planctomycetota bacterium]|nr:glycosyltransferase family 4 protein [Planctomycetota bacterium]